MAVNKRILIVDDNEMMARTLYDIFSFQGFAPDVAHSAEEALDRVREQRYLCVVSDIRMPGLNGVDMYREMKAIVPGIPVILMTAYTNDLLIQQGLDEGVLGVLSKPLDMQRLMEVLEVIGEAPSAVVVDDDPAFAQALADILPRHGVHVRTTANPDALPALLTSPHQVVILDLDLGTTDGVAVLTRLTRQRPGITVILVTAYGTELRDLVEEGLRRGAIASFDKPLNVDALLDTIQQARNRHLRDLLAH